MFGDVYELEEITSVTGVWYACNLINVSTMQFFVHCHLNNYKDGDQCRPHHQYIAKQVARLVNMYKVTGDDWDI